MRTYPLGSPGRVEDGRGSLGHAATIVGVCRLIANHLHLAFFESTPEVRALPSAGITRLQRSYYPVRLPPMPPPRSDGEAATLAPNGWYCFRSSSGRR